MDANLYLATGMATPRGSVFAQTNHHPVNYHQVVCRLAGQRHAAGETVHAQSLTLPQAPVTARVLGLKPADAWGFTNGINEHHVAIGISSWRSRLASPAGVLNTDLVRLALERCTAARHAVDLLTDMITRHGQTTSNGEDSIFLVADPSEAYLLETAGSYWAWTECRSIRAVSNVAVIRQDWQRLAPGAAEHAANHGWWECDGSKADFAGCFIDEQPRSESAQKRWARSTYLLEEQHGRIDSTCMRKILSESARSMRPCGLPPRDSAHTCNDMISLLAADGVPMIWAAFGPPHLSIFVPLLLDGDVPASCKHWHPTNVWVRIQNILAAIAGNAEQEKAWQRHAFRLQARIDQETAEFLQEFGAMRMNAEPALLERQATLFMQNHVELLENALRKPQFDIESTVNEAPTVAFDRRPASTRLQPSS